MSTTTSLNSISSPDRVSNPNVSASERDWIAEFVEITKGLEFSHEANEWGATVDNQARAEAVGGRVLDAANRDLSADIARQRDWIDGAVDDTFRAGEAGPTLERQISEEQAEQIRLASDAHKLGVAIKWQRDYEQAGTINLN